ncbi:MAG TPA: hypothetical protein VGE43_02945, partial [Acidimicrobiales bacterium]
MLSSIHPLGERGKGNRFGITAGAFLVGATLGGAATGAVTALLSIPVGAVTSTTVATVVGSSASTGMLSSASSAPVVAPPITAPTRKAP